MYMIWSFNGTVTTRVCMYMYRTGHQKDVGLGGGNSGESSEEFEAHDFPDQGAITMHVFQYIYITYVHNNYTIH